MLIFFIVAVLLVLVIGYAGLKKMQQRLPAAASCSLVVSAACHTPVGERDTQWMKVKWGVVRGEGGERRGHCAVSGGTVRRPEVGGGCAVALLKGC